MKSKWVYWFNVPVDPEKHGARNYFQTVLHPRDFSTVHYRLQLAAGKPAQLSPVPASSPEVPLTPYLDPNEFIDDVRFIFRNAFLYNGEQHEVTRTAVLLSKQFEAELAKLNSVT